MMIVAIAHTTSRHTTSTTTTTGTITAVIVEAFAVMVTVGMVTAVEGCGFVVVRDLVAMVTAWLFSIIGNFEVVTITVTEKYSSDHIILWCKYVQLKQKQIL